MDAQRWQRVGIVFDRVIEAPLDARTGILDELCADDPELRRDVERLLAADRKAHAFDRGVDSARGAVAADWASAGDVPSWQAGERIGPWRVLREIGRGGMGVVLLADRADGQFEQRAAIKLIKRGMDSDAVQSRFLRERQILARLAHPHIARLLDGGIDQDGRPYFAMEYVDGEPLLRYCAQCELNVERRIALFIDICAAVQFAHGQLVIHRDIKPSNLVVTADGEAKLLDFGIAKLLDDSHGGMTQTVDALHRPLTPAYAAPEQIRGEPVSTSTDIYSLGVVLFELLTGKRPFDLRDTSGVDEARRVIDATTTTPLPSRSVDDTAPATSRMLRGDLDTIIVTAMQREPQRRYATVDAFAKDLQRYLAGQPISARRDSVRYRLNKFVARHRLGVAAVFAGLIVLVVALGFALWQAREKTRQALVSQQVTQFLVGIFRGADPSVSRGAKISAQDLLDQGTERLQSDTRVAPEVRARLLQTVATTYTDLGLYEKALPLARDALGLRRNEGARDDVDVAESLDELGRIYRLKGDYAQSEPLLREALRIRREVLPAEDPALIESVDHLGTLLSAKGEFRGAEELQREALHLAEQRFGKDDVETARYLDDYASALDNIGRRQDARDMYRRALNIRENRLGPDDADVATSLINLGTHLDESGEHTDAQKLLERALAIRIKIFGPTHPLVGFAELALAGTADTTETLDRGDALASDALSIFRRELPDDHPKISETLNMMCVLRTARRDFAGAAPLMREVVDRFRRTLGDEHPDTLTAENNLGYVLLHAGLLTESEALLRGVLDRLHGDNGQLLLVTDRENLANTLVSEKKFSEAIAFAANAVDVVRRAEGGESGNLAVALGVLARAEELAGADADAEKHLREALRVGDLFARAHNAMTYQWTLPLTAFLAAHDRCAEAIPLIDKALQQIDATKDADALYRPQAVLIRGYCAQPAAASSADIEQARATLLKMPAIAYDVYPIVGRMLASAKTTQPHTK